ncbi:DNA-processing protein DprA [Leucobacter sp. gxy201]|uniref:DNA-processing protein DprA n=1 Tax=Leucobacter sp. gxy201 TaxID=2957200 RepID=UPI003DA0A983
MTGTSIHVAADSATRARLASLHPEAAAFSPEQFDALFARVVWSRLAEPADAAAGALIAALGTGAALDLLVSGTDARSFFEAARIDPTTGISPRTIAAGIRRWLPRLDQEASIADLDHGVAHGMRLVVPGSGLWPSALHDLGDHAPVILWTRGDPEALSVPSLAVVGARACTGYGTHVTAEFTDAACAAGAGIVSGAAYGVDAVAHRTALAADAPTVAVVAGGADRPYPAAHAQLLERIAGAGAICSEMVPGSAPTRWRFLMRNRIIAALANATLVTEAGARSGSLNTAGHAAEIGRPLGAVPGPVTSPASTGCHRLITEYGAALITGADDIRMLLGVDGTDLLPGGERESHWHRRVIDALPLRGARSTADAARLAGLSDEEAGMALAELEALGQVRRRETPGADGPAWALVRRE